MAWVRTDGRRIVDDPADEASRECMAQKGYVLVQKDQAEEARAAYAAATAQRGPIPSAR
jgi:hypothetical protein